MATLRRRLPSGLDLDWENQKTPVWNHWPTPGVTAIPSSVTEDTEWHVSVLLRTRQIRRLVQLGLASNSALAWRLGLPMWMPISAIPELVGAIRQPRTGRDSTNGLDTYQLAPLERRRLHVSGSETRLIGHWAKLMTTPGCNMGPSESIVRRAPPQQQEVRVARETWDDAAHEQSHWRAKRPAQRRYLQKFMILLAAAAVGWTVGSLLFGGEPVPALRRAVVPDAVRTLATRGVAASSAAAAVPPAPVTPSVSTPTAEATAPAPVAVTEVAALRAPVEAARGEAAGAASTAAAPTAAAPTAAALGPFDTRAAARALKLATGMASSCTEGQAATARVVVTFAPSGRVSNVKLSGLTVPEARRCVQSAFRRVRVPAFDGASLTVGKTIQLR